VAITRLKTSSIIEGFPKSKSILTGNDAIFAGSYESIQTVTVGSGGTSTLTFSSIPSTYTHLQVRSLAKNSTTTNVWMRINSDTGANYATHYLNGDGSSASASNYINQGDGIFYGYNTGLQSSTAVLDLLDYANTNKFKTTRSLTGFDANGSGQLYLWSGLWRSTAAVNSLTIYSQGGTFTEYSSFALYGIK
jgi:hypothetical protein